MIFFKKSKCQGFIPSLCSEIDNAKKKKKIMSPKYFLLFEVKLYVKPYSPRHHGILGITSGDLT